MPKNADWQDTYCSPDTGNVRYPSTAKESIGGFAYVYTQDIKYVRELDINHFVQVWDGKSWTRFDGQNLGQRAEVEGPPQFDPDEEEDPNW
nr:hypothetical protein [uncultured bacterium]